MAKCRKYIGHLKQVLPTVIDNRVMLQVIDYLYVESSKHK